MKILKTILKVLLVIVIILVVLVGALLAWLTAVEYKPADTEEVKITSMNPQQKALKKGDTIDLMAWNIGYAALGDNADFFMDGGKMVYSADEARVRENINAIVNEVKANDPDLLLVQEIDL
ncbi:MAG: endonuclease, partial [Clostridiales bacterium]|nr:endonuclease [Clostridiales bacterium]